MKEKIKIINLILSIPLLILVITALVIWISQQIINKDFFTFNQEECISEYLDSKYRGQRIGNLSDKQIEEISQVWGLDKKELLSMRKGEFSYEDWEKAVGECMDEARRRGEKRGRLSAVEICEKQVSARFLLFTSVEDLTKNKKPIITDSLVKKLTVEGICLRPSLLK